MKSKLVLVFPPFALPTYVPLASAQLKSFLAAVADVECMDLNVLYHHELFERLKGKEKNKVERNAVKASRLLRGDSSKLFDEHYDEYAGDFLSYLNSVHREYDDDLRACFSEGKEIPQYIYGFVEMILEKKPDMVGFSTMLTTQWVSSCLIARLIKEINSSVKIVFGGSSVATMAKEKFVPEFMDYMIYGEAEKGFEALIRSSSDLSKVPSLIYVKDGEVMVNEREEMKDLSQMPAPDFSDYQLGLYYNPEIVLPVYTSRSCPYKKCTFCIHYRTFHTYKGKSAEQVVGELEKYMSEGISYFNFVDEMIMPGFWTEFCDLVKEKGLKFFFHCTCKPMKGFDARLFQRLYDVGCRLIIWGLESGSQKILDKMQKGVTVEELEGIFAASAGSGIRNFCLLIVGFPGEKEKEFSETISFLEKNRKNIHAVIASHFLLYEESDIFEHPEKYGITKIYEKDQLKRHYVYDITDGLRFEEIVLLHHRYQDFFGGFNTVSNCLNTLRDQALVYYSR